MDTWAFDDWQQAGMDLCSIMLDGPIVVMLRLARIAQGGLAGTLETELMVTEKIAALLHFQAGIAGRQFGPTPLSSLREVLRYCEPKVAANRKRLGG